jgi:UDP-N-acetylglucosamine 2-epimerase (non-hydrolysing)
VAIGSTCNRRGEALKVVTILGTRPELIRLSRVVPRLDELVDHVVIHTGQNYDVNLNDVFFDELGLRAPDYHLGAKGSFGSQIGTIVAGTEEILRKERPDRFLVLGDTNSSLAAIAAKRLAVPVFHMEAGNRCYDDRVPEEVNRRIIDHSSDVLMPYTERSRQNLLREGIAGEKIFVTGNPIFEVLQHFAGPIENSAVLDKLGLTKQKYILVTMHREENVDREPRLRALLESLDVLTREYDMPVICSIHPRTRKRLDEFGIAPTEGGVQFSHPFGFFDFVKLEMNAACVLSDSGTVQEECAIFGVPNVTIRDVTERPETLERGTNILSGILRDDVIRSVRIVWGASAAGMVPPEYTVKNVSNTVARLVLGYFTP